MITKENLTDKLKDIQTKDFDPKLKELHDFTMNATENGTNWNAYSAENTRFVIDAYLKMLNDFVSHSKPETEKKSEKPKKETRHTEKNEKPARTKPIRQPVEVIPVQAEETDDVELVERIPEEIKFMRRYLSFNGKKKTREDFLRFINAMQRAIIEKKIRRTSRYAKQMNYIQENLLKVYNSMGKSIPVQIRESIVAQFKELISSEKVMPSVRLIKRYINLNGKYGVKEKAKVLINAMTRAFEKGLITKSDQYFKIFDEMHLNLSKYIKNKSQKVLSIEPAELNGLNGFLSGCCCENVRGIEEDLSGVDSQEQLETRQRNENEVMNSMDFKNMRFNTLGFNGKYRELIGDPSPGFTAMVYGKPKMGKSFLCVDFAGYLARRHGKVLYVAKEEGLDFTLQEKLRAKDVAHPNLYVAGSIPEDLSPYQFIFLDSVNRLGLSVEDLQALKRNNPGKSFIYIFQTTKDGNFRGANEFQHDVDVVIEVPEKGLAVQNGRFNPGGEMQIFDDENYREAA